MKLLFMMLVLACSSIRAASSLSLFFPPAPIVPGGTAMGQVIISTGDPTQYPAAVQFNIVPPADVVATSLTTDVAATTSQKQISCGPLNGGVITCLVWGLNVQGIQNGSIAKVALRLAPSIALLSETVGLGAAEGASPTDAKDTITASGASFAVQSPCDLNGDGVVDIKDVQVSLAQAEAGGTACTTGAYNGTCDVVAVQRIINAAVPNGVCKP